MHEPWRRIGFGISVKLEEIRNAIHESVFKNHTGKLKEEVLC